MRLSVASWFVASLIASGAYIDASAYCAGDLGMKCQTAFREVGGTNGIQALDRNGISSDTDADHAEKFIAYVGTCSCDANSQMMSWYQGIADKVSPKLAAWRDGATARAAEKQAAIDAETKHQADLKQQEDAAKAKHEADLLQGSSGKSEKQDVGSTSTSVMPSSLDGYGARAAELKQHAVNDSKFYKDCAKHGNLNAKMPENVSMLQTNRPGAFALACSLKSGGQLWTVSLMSSGPTEQYLHFNVHEELDIADLDNLENPRSIGFVQTTDFKPANDTQLKDVELAGNLKKGWQKALGGATQVADVKFLKQNCDKGNASACDKYLQGTKIKDEAYLTKACGQKSQVACTQLNEFKAAAADAQARQQKAAAEEQARQQKAASKECTVAKKTKSYCIEMRTARILQISIDREKAIGKETGYVNASKMNKDVEARMQVETLAKKEAAAIQQTGSRAPAAETCQIVDDDNGYTASIAAPLDAQVKAACGE